MGDEWRMRYADPNGLSLHAVDDPHIILEGGPEVSCFKGYRTCNKVKQDQLNYVMLLKQDSKSIATHPTD